ncbi:hypothetical protein GSS87_04000 [Corynebacterium sp. 4HC-13]|uniref:Uncharacterized protein n=1 Tax=Corynebacterium anserum TaxID=2684406 RepID=A0A7G7YR10_9CORY|nr:hypothetical protein [Corynebacterium anserum]QNH96930.1 hypothetical protein GP473_04375 [Corynebacterium anserum]
MWLAWWLHNVISTDELIDAFHSVQGPLHIFDAVPCPKGHAAQVRERHLEQEVVTSHETPAGLVDLLRQIRTATNDAPVGLEEQPLVSLILSGPGDVPPLPAGSLAAQHIVRTGAGLVLPTDEPDISHVLVPEMRHSEYHEVDAIHWTWHVIDQPTPPMPIYSPGEAEHLLRTSTDQAAGLIENSADRYAHHPNVHLAVGRLRDAFGLPGLPHGISERAAKLMARADYVSALVAVVRNGEPGASLDPFLLPLMRAVRVARTTAVDYAQRELVR